MENATPLLLWFFDLKRFNIAWNAFNKDLETQISNGEIIEQITIARYQRSTISQWIPIEREPIRVCIQHPHFATRTHFWVGQLQHKILNEGPIVMRAQ